MNNQPEGYSELSERLLAPYIKLLRDTRDMFLNVITMFCSSHVLVDHQLLLHIVAPQYNMFTALAKT